MQKEETVFTSARDGFHRRPFCNERNGPRGNIFHYVTTSAMKPYRNPLTVKERKDEVSWDANILPIRHQYLRHKGIEFIGYRWVSELRDNGYVFLFFVGDGCMLLRRLWRTIRCFCGYDWPECSTPGGLNA